MSAAGTKRTSMAPVSVSSLRGKADDLRRLLQRLLMTQSGHVAMSSLRGVEAGPSPHLNPAAHKNMALADFDAPHPHIARRRCRR